MAASSPIEPSGGSNHIAIDFISPKTLGGPIEIRDQADSTGYGAFNTSNSSLLFDIINEYTPGAGVTIEGVQIINSEIVGLRIDQDVQAYSADLAAIAAITAPADGSLLVGDGSSWVEESGNTLRQSIGLELGVDAQAYDAGLAGLSAMSTSAGIVSQTAANTFSPRTITGTSNRISVSNGSGAGGNPTINIDSSYVGQTSITTLGTITTGTWQGTAIAVNQGGTGSTSASGARGALNAAKDGANTDITSLGDCSSVTNAGNLSITASGGSSDLTLTAGLDVNIVADEWLNITAGTTEGVRFTDAGDGDVLIIDFDPGDNAIRPNTAGSFNLGTATEYFNGLNVATVNFVNTLTTAGSLDEYLPIQINGVAKKLAVYNNS